MVAIFALIFVGILTCQMSDNTLVSGDASQLGVAASYVPLTNGFPQVDTSGGITVFIDQLFKWGIAIAVVLSILMIVLGGFQYMSSESIGGKMDGKTRIKGSLAGLLLALSAWTILNTINPQILHRSGRLFNVENNLKVYV